MLAPQQRVLFLDTDGMSAPEVRAGDALSNPWEAAVITDILRALVLGQVPLHEIGVVSPYRAQVSPSCVTPAAHVSSKMQADICAAQVRQSDSAMACI